MRARYVARGYLAKCEAIYAKVAEAGLFGGDGSLSSSSSSSRAPSAAFGAFGQSAKLAGSAAARELAREFADLALGGLIARDGERSGIGALPTGFADELVDGPLAEVIPVTAARRG